MKVNNTKIKVAASYTEDVENKVNEKVNALLTPVVEELAKTYYRNITVDVKITVE